MCILRPEREEEGGWEEEKLGEKGEEDEEMEGVREGGREGGREGERARGVQGR